MFDELPTELVERILAFLTYEEKVLVLGVCKRWRTILQKDTGPPNLVVDVQVLSELKDLSRWDASWNAEKAHYLIGQFVLLPKRLGGHPVYKQAETVGNESYFIFWDRGASRGSGEHSQQGKWKFSHVLGASDGRYPSIDQNAGLPPKEWNNKNGDTILKILIPAELKFCQSVVIGTNAKDIILKAPDIILKAPEMPKGLLGTFHLMEGVWSCGRPVYKGPKDCVLMVTGKRWGVKRKLESWGEVVLQAKEASMGPGGGAPWMLSTGKGIWNVDRDVTVTELD